MPDPDRPVTTIRLSRGISTEMFLRLWTRAPCTAIVVRGGGLRFQSRLAVRCHRWLLEIEERQLLHVDVAPLGQLTGVDALPISPWSARYSHAVVTPLDVEVPLEVVLDLAARARFADLAQMVEDRREQRGARSAR